VGGYPKEGNESDITLFGTSVTGVVPEPILTLSGIHHTRELEIHMPLDHGGWREDDFPLDPVDRSRFRSGRPAGGASDVSPDTDSMGEQLFGQHCWGMFNQDLNLAVQALSAIVVPLFLRVIVQRDLLRIRESSRPDG